MCTPYPQSDVVKTPPHEELANFLGRFGIASNPEVLRLVIENHWHRLSVLAHAVHGQHVRVERVGC